MNKKEKTYVVIVILLLLLLITKSFYLDEYRPRNEDEELFNKYVHKIIEDRKNGILQRMNIVTYRVVDIKKLNGDGISVIEVYDEKSKQYKNAEIFGQYKAKIRKYLFYFMPFGEQSILSRK